MFKFIFLMLLLTTNAFAQENMNSCFLLYNMKTGKFEQEVGGNRCREQFVACSTFKVPLAVMAFDAGILHTPEDVLKWDGKVESRPEVNQDQDSWSWMKNSVVWFSKRLTPQLGKERFQQYLHDFHYGNEDLSGGITQAWLVAPSKEGPALKISAYEQVEFMKNLWSDNLPVSKRSMQIARDLTYLETSPKGFKLNGKTGSNAYNDNWKMRLGWFIGHISNGSQEYIAVSNFSDVTPTTEEGYGGVKAKAMTKEKLAALGLW